MAEAVDARHLEGRSQRLAEAADVTLVVKATQFPCHSSVLAVTSNFFDSLFNDLPGQAAAVGEVHWDGRWCGMEETGWQQSCPQPRLFYMCGVSPTRRAAAARRAGHWPPAAGPSPHIVLVPEGADDHPLTAENFAVYLHQLYREPSY